MLQVRENNAALAQDLMAAGESSGGGQDGAARESLSMARSLQAEPRPKKAGGTPLDIARVKAETEALKKQVHDACPTTLSSCSCSRSLGRVWGSDLSET